MKDIQLGDKVRLTRVIEGRVSMLDGQAFALDDQFGWFDPTLVEVEILEKRKPQVGDVLESRRKFVNLPEGSVVTNGDGDALIVRHGRTYAPGLTSPAVLMPGLRFADFSPGCTPYTVVYIPSV